MIITKGHNILAHSRSSTSEEFALFIYQNTYCLNIGQIKPLKYYALSAFKKIYELNELEIRFNRKELFSLRPFLLLTDLGIR